MTKHLRFLFVMLLAMIWSAGWAAIGDNFKLVTDAKDLKAGDKIIIGSKASNVVLGADNGSKKRLAVSATFSSDGVVAWQEGFDVITLEGSASAWYLHSEAGYLYSDKKKSNATTNLLTIPTKSDANIASIKVDKNGATIISFINVASDRGIYCNTSTPSSLIFGYYQHTFKNKKPSQIYKLVNSDDKTSTTLSFDTETNVFNVEKNSESLFVAPKAVVKDAAGIVVAGANITYESDAPTIASVDENGKVTFGSEIGTATITASYAGDDTYKPAESISYTITYSKIPTVMAWSQSSISVNLGDTFTAPTLTFTAHDVNILEGKTIKYNSSDENVAMIDETGIVLMGKAGSAKISATFAGDDTYTAASAEYTLNVVDPNKTDVTFDFTDPEKYGYSKPASGKSTDLSNGDKLESNGVTITSVQGGTSTKTRFYNSSNAILLRVYTGAILTVEAPAGCAINRIDFTDDGSKTVNNFNFSTGKLSSKTWTGLAKILTIKVDKNSVFLKNMTVNLVKLVELDENSESNTIEAKTGVNVTLNRPMKIGQWNTFCVPFSIDATQVTSQFGEGTQIAKFALSDKKFIYFETTGIIEAGKAYLVKPTKEAATEGYTFSNVNITALKPTKENVDNGAIDFRGIYNPTDITVGLPANTFAAGIVGNVVKKAVSDSNMKGFRAFFIIPEGVGAQSSYMLKIDGTVTSINSINGADVVVNAPVYNLQGQRVDGNNLTPGIYVKAGKKFVVK